MEVDSGIVGIIDTPVEIVAEHISKFASNNDLMLFTMALIDILDSKQAKAEIKEIHDFIDELK